MAKTTLRPAETTLGKARLRSAAPSVPSLENGDRLARCEFERRYAARPEVKKAEVIEGVVYMPASARATTHARPHYALITWLGVYSTATPGVTGADHAKVRLDLDNEPQPGVLLLQIDQGTGRSRVSGDDYVKGAPELVAEIAASSASIDLHAKLAAYRRNGVRDHIVWCTQDKRGDWFELADGAYNTLPQDRLAAWFTATSSPSCA